MFLGLLRPRHDHNATLRRLRKNVKSPNEQKVDTQCNGQQLTLTFLESITAMGLQSLDVPVRHLSLVSAKRSHRDLFPLNVDLIIYVINLKDSKSYP
jgi:hypothetical protein